MISDKRGERNSLKSEIDSSNESDSESRKDLRDIRHEEIIRKSDKVKDNNLIDMMDDNDNDDWY